MTHRPFQLKIRYLMFANVCVAIWLAIYFGVNGLMFGGGWEWMSAIQATLITGLFVLPVGLFLVPPGLERDRLGRAYWALANTLFAVVGIAFGIFGLTAGLPGMGELRPMYWAWVVISTLVLVLNLRHWWQWTLSSPPCPACGQRALFTSMTLRGRRVRACSCSLCGGRWVRDKAGAWVEASAAEFDRLYTPVRHRRGR